MNASYHTKQSLICAIACATLTLQAGVAAVRADRDVFLADVNGQVAIGSANHTPPPEPDLVTRVFGRVMISGFPPFDPANYGLDDPGYFALPTGDAELPAGASALPANASVSVHLPTFTVGSSSDTMFFWNGNGAVNFQPISTAQPGVSLAVDPNPIGDTGTNGGADIHPTYRLDLGGAGVPADGVYVNSPTVSVAGLADSHRFFTLWLVDHLVTDEDAADEVESSIEAGSYMALGKDFHYFQQAGQFVQTNLVPEPGAAMLALAGLTWAILLAPQRRARRGEV